MEKKCYEIENKTSSFNLRKLSFVTPRNFHTIRNKIIIVNWKKIEKYGIKTLWTHPGTPNGIIVYYYNNDANNGPLVYFDDALIRQHIYTFEKSRSKQMKKSYFYIHVAPFLWFYVVSWCLIEFCPLTFYNCVSCIFSVSNKANTNKVQIRLTNVIKRHSV